MTPSVNFSEHYQPTFSTQTLIPISILTDCDSLIYSGGLSASNREIQTLFALSNQLAASKQSKVHTRKAAVIGPHSALLAKIILNSSIDYIVTAITHDAIEQKNAEQFINNPNLFDSRLARNSDLPIDSDEVNEYFRVIIFTDYFSFVSYPIEMLSQYVQIFAPITQTAKILDHFAAHELASRRMTVTDIQTLITGTHKIFTIQGHNEKNSNL